MNRFIGYLLLIGNLLSAMNILNMDNPNSYQMWLCTVNIIVAALILTSLTRKQWK